MGIGAVIYEGDNILYEHSEHIPASRENSNNVAEYMAMNAVLDWLIMHGYTGDNILIRGDSKLSVMQCAGKWNINKGIYVPLAYKARELKQNFINIRFEWIPRELNDYADRLSKQPMKKAGVIFKIQPNG